MKGEIITVENGGGGCKWCSEGPINVTRGELANHPLEDLRAIEPHLREPQSDSELECMRRLYDMALVHYQQDPPLLSISPWLMQSPQEQVREF